MRSKVLHGDEAVSDHVDRRSRLLEDDVADERFVAAGRSEHALLLVRLHGDARLLVQPLIVEPVEARRPVDGVQADDPADESSGGLG